MALLKYVAIPGIVVLALASATYGICKEVMVLKFLSTQSKKTTSQVEVFENNVENIKTP